MESSLRSGQAGNGIRDCNLPGQAWHGVSALESASLAGSVGVGTTGDLIGITTISFWITTAMYPTAECSSIAITSMLPEVDSVVAAASMGEISMARPRSTDSPHRMPRLVLAPALSVALIMAARREVSQLVGSRASAEAVFTAEVVVAGAGGVEVGVKRKICLPDTLGSMMSSRIQIVCDEIMRQEQLD